MKYLVTGCAGFIGSCLAERLLNEGYSVIGLDCFSDYYDPLLKRRNLSVLQAYERFIFHEFDLLKTDFAPLLDGIDGIYHTSGQPGVRGSWGQQFHLYVRNNIEATQHLLETIKTMQKPLKVVYSSSSSIYGNTENLPTTEQSLPQPYSPYGMTKLAAEHLCMLYHANYGLPTVSLRYFTVYGPRQRPDMAFHIFMKSMLQGNPISVLGDGSQTRDFTYVDDIVDANLLAMQKPIEGEVFNIGGGCRISLIEVIQLLQDITGIQPEIVKRTRFQGDVKDTWADTTKAQKLLGYQPKVSLRDGLQREWEWMKEFVEAEKEQYE